MTEETESAEALRAEQKEIREARGAIKEALYRVGEAGERLRSAKELGTLDLWGGGLFVSIVKHDRIAEADHGMQNVDRALESVRKELADLGIHEVGSVGVTPMSRTLDVWFDNLFSDLATQRRIKDASSRLDALAATLVQVESRLGRRDLEIAHRLADAP